MRRLACALAVTMLAGACSSSGSETAPSNEAPTTTPQAPATAPPPVETTPVGTDASGDTQAVPDDVSVELDVASLVRVLASDAMGGRDNGTEGSLIAQRTLIGQLAQIAEPAFPEKVGNEQWLQPFDGGSNILGVIPGGDLADEYLSSAPTTTISDRVSAGRTTRPTSSAAERPTMLPGSPSPLRLPVRSSLTEPLAAP